jgi:hypothetical protein
MCRDELYTEKEKARASISIFRIRIRALHGMG